MSKFEKENGDEAQTVTVKIHSGKFRKKKAEGNKKQSEGRQLTARTPARRRRPPHANCDTGQSTQAEGRKRRPTD
jgi:hypothetical protein